MREKADVALMCPVRRGKDTLRCLSIALKMMPKGHQSISLHDKKDLTFIGLHQNHHADRFMLLITMKI
nr:calcium-transporting ATPase 3, endoplasmic reticulum-type isoform X1 [Tanacetum cinerariifolium]